MQGGRLFQIVYLLLAQESMTVSTLSKQLEVSERTIRRDVDALSAAGIPIYTTRGRNGGVSLLPDFVLNKSLLSSREQDEILYALQSFSATGIETAALKQLSTLFKREPSDWVSVDFSSWGSPTSAKELHAQLKDAILSCKVVEFDYFSSTRAQKTHRIVEPYKLHFKGFGWYLQGFCRERGDFRTFRLTRMDNLTIQNTLFSSNKTPPALDNLVAPTIATTEVTLRFSPSVFYRVFDEFERENILQNEDGFLIVTTNMHIDWWSIEHILSFGIGVEVLSPNTLRQQIKKHLQKMLENFS